MDEGEGMKAETNDTKTSATRPRLTIFVTSAIILIALVFMFISPMLNPPEEAFKLESSSFGTTNAEIAKVPDGFGGMQVGEVAPDFELLDVDGNSVSLSSFAGQPVMINFWATWCAPCRIEMPEMQAVYEARKDEGFVILALNQDESAETVTAYFHDEMNLTFTPLLDTNSVVSANYGVYGFNPSSFFIDPDGVISARHIGPLTAGQLESYLEEIIQ